MGDFFEIQICLYTNCLILEKDRTSPAERDLRFATTSWCTPIRGLSTVPEA